MVCSNTTAEAARWTKYVPSNFYRQVVMNIGINLVCGNGVLLNQQLFTYITYAAHGYNTYVHLMRYVGNGLQLLKPSQLHSHVIRTDTNGRFGAQLCEIIKWIKSIASVAATIQ